MEKRPNWFVRILIILLCLFIGGLIYFSFFGNGYYGIKTSAQITAPLLVLIAFLAVLVLSEAFDNFSIGKLVTLSRKVKEKEETNKELKKENGELRNQILTISTNITQKQVNSTFFLADEISKMFTVKPANQEEKGIKEKEEEETRATTTTTTTTTNDSGRRIISYSNLEKLVLQKFLRQKDLQLYPIIKEAKLKSHFEQFDPISEYSPVFDAYVKATEMEVFIELRTLSRPAYLRTRDQVYVMLSKINFYKTLKKANAFLFLVFYFRPDDDLSQGQALIETLNNEFAPAISNGLLQVGRVEISPDEFSKLLE